MIKIHAAKMRGCVVTPASVCPLTQNITASNDEDKFCICKSENIPCKHYAGYSKKKKAYFCKAGKLVHRIALDPPQNSQTPPSQPLQPSTDVEVQTDENNPNQKAKGKVKSVDQATGKVTVTVGDTEVVTDQKNITTS